jgi:hypothetical protein
VSAPWFVGRFSIATAADGETVLDALSHAVGQTRVATISVDDCGETWRGCPPGSTSAIVLERGVIPMLLGLTYERRGVRWRLCATAPVRLEVVP